MSVRGRVTWVKVDERVFVEAMGVEVLLRDYADDYADVPEVDQPGAAEIIVQIADMFGEVARGQGGRELTIR